MFLAVHEWIDCELLIGTVTKVVVGTVFIVSVPLQQFFVLCFTLPKGWIIFSVNVISSQEATILRIKLCTSILQTLKCIHNFAVIGHTWWRPVAKSCSEPCFIVNVPLQNKHHAVLKKTGNTDNRREYKRKGQVKLIKATQTTAVVGK